MRRLILIKHSAPEIDPAVPANQWHLSEAGRHMCTPLSEKLAPYKPSIIISSVEPKAEETAALLSALLEVPYETADGLQEHVRTNVGWLSEQALADNVAAFYARPDYLAFGEETAEQVQERFLEAVDSALARHDQGNVAIVSHGTAMCLFISNMTSWPPYPLWQQLQTPSFVVLSLPVFEVSVIVESLESPPAT